MKGRRLEVLPDGERLALAAADRVEELLCGGSGPFRMALAGGRTPRRLYQLLAGRALPWERLELFLGDERCVPWDHPDSNFRMARESLLSGSGLTSAQIHPWDTSLAPEEAAEGYERRLLEAFSPGPPAFDLVLLGMGDDGHTASLFPGTEALEIEDRLTAAQWVGEGKGWRLTFTFPLLNQARRVLFLVAGAEKAPALRRVLEEGELPASRVHGTEETVFMVDRGARGGPSSEA